ncbi:hypothetical protein AB0C33_37860 [Nonomuraea sp. NPDC048881]|uniref:DUF7507 domain-containing protein n=1 Tax=Nonomuraea sp. NPDC048881 TaxID=3155030 RepID=UPI0033C01E59
MAVPQNPAPGGCGPRISLINGSFEAPVVSNYEIRPDASHNDPRAVPGWRTTASDGRIELWRTGFQNVPADDGQQFAELNANMVSTLYQDVPTTPGTKLYWKLSHRGRQGADTMALQIGPPNAPVEQARMTDGNTAWGHYTGEYVVPPGQSTTRFAFKSISAAGGNPAIGNFLDGIVFGTAPCVVLTKAAIPEGEVEVGDVITYRVNARNEGGAPADNLVLTDDIPAGTSYVPGSLRVIDGPGSGGKSDAAGDDQAYVDAGAGRVVFHLGQGATAQQGGSLPSTADAPNGTTVEFRVRVERAGAGRQIENQARATYDNTLGNAPDHLTSTSNATTTPVKRVVELAVVKAADRTEAAVGEAVTYHVAVTNKGPNDATGVTVVDQLPEGLAFISATATAGSYDPATGLWDVGAMDVGTTHTLTLLAKATQPGPLTNTATATANETDGPVTDEVVVCARPPAPCPPHGGCGCGGGCGGC